MNALLSLCCHAPCLPGQFTLPSTRVCVWTPPHPHAWIMSKEECSYNERLYCSSAIASVHHTDKGLSVDRVRQISVGLCNGSLRVHCALSDSC